MPLLQLVYAALPAPGLRSHSLTIIDLNTEAQRINIAKKLGHTNFHFPQRVVKLYCCQLWVGLFCFGRILVAIWLYFQDEAAFKSTAVTLRCIIDLQSFWQHCRVAVVCSLL